jgi:hypothetical protein
VSLAVGLANPLTKAVEPQTRIPKLHREANIYAAGAAAALLREAAALPPEAVVCASASCAAAVEVSDSSIGCHFTHFTRLCALRFDCSVVCQCPVRRPIHYLPSNTCWHMCAHSGCMAACLRSCVRVVACAYAVVHAVVFGSVRTGGKLNI